MRKPKSIAVCRIQKKPHRDSVGLPYHIQQFTTWAYPEREAPPIHNFALYCASMKRSTE